MEFVWQPHENMVHYSQGAYYWNDEAVTRLIFKKIGGIGSAELGMEKLVADSVLGCSGNLVACKIGVHYMTVDYASAEGIKSASFGNNEEIKVGRMIDCNVKLFGANCSRYQCTLRRVHGEWILEVGNRGKVPEKGIWKLVASSAEPIDPQGIYMIGGLIVRPLLSSPT